MPESSARGADVKARLHRWAAERVRYGVIRSVVAHKGLLSLQVQSVVSHLVFMGKPRPQLNYVTGGLLRGFLRLSGDMVLLLPP